MSQGGTRFFQRAAADAGAKNAGRGGWATGPQSQLDEEIEWSSQLEEELQESSLLQVFELKLSSLQLLLKLSLESVP